MRPELYGLSIVWSQKRGDIRGRPRLSRARGARRTAFGEQLAAANYSSRCEERFPMVLGGRALRRRCFAKDVPAEKRDSGRAPGSVWYFARGRNRFWS